MKNFFLNYGGLLIILVIGLGLVSPSFVMAAGPPTVNLLSASNFSLVSKTGITNTGSHSSIITGNIGSSPITAAALNDVFCSEITGTIYGVNSAYVGSGIQTCFAGNPPLSNKTIIDNAVIDMSAAYTDAANRPATAPNTNLFGGNLGGQTLTPGLYKWTSDVIIPTNVTLSGGANDVWIMQIAGNLNISSGASVPAGTKVLLTGGAQASNVFWQVGGGVGATLGTYSTFNGSILSATQVVMQTGAVLNGRALTQTLITLDANTVSSPTGGAASLNVIKIVVNGTDGSSAPSDFVMHVMLSGTDVLSSPSAGTAAGTVYNLAPGTYVVSENANSAYSSSFSGDCNATGDVTLTSGSTKNCTITNTAIRTSSGGAIPPVTPAIGVSKTSSPTSLTAGPAVVTYSYTVWNVGKQRALTDIKVIDNRCAPVNYVSGDVNVNNKIEPSESWAYICKTTLQNTTTNTVTVTGISDDPYRQTASASAIITVAVNGSKTTTPVVPPTSTPISTPVSTPIPINNPIITSSTPSTTLTPPKSASSTTKVPGLPSTGVPDKSTSTWPYILLTTLLVFSSLMLANKRKAL